MKTTYIYLNQYKTYYNEILYYVGSHTWEGPVGQLDPNYHGSSQVALAFGWTPVKEEILEVVSPERARVAEREWINKYADELGIADCAKSVFKYSKIWMDSKPGHGKLINCHCNDARQACEAARSKEARKHHVASMDYNSISKKRWESLSKEKRQEAARKKNTHLGVEWMREHIKNLNIDNYNKGRCCILNDGFVGKVSDIVEHTGLKKGSVGAMFTKAYKEGIAKCQDWVFKPTDEVRIKQKI